MGGSAENDSRDSRDRTVPIVTAQEQSVIDAIAAKATYKGQLQMQLGGDEVPSPVSGSRRGGQSGFRMEMQDYKRRGTPRACPDSGPLDEAKSLSWRLKS